MAEDKRANWGRAAGNRRRASGRRSASLGYQPHHGNQASRVGAVLNRIVYKPTWTLSAGPDGSLMIFRPDTEHPTCLLSCEPIPIPEDADDEEILRIAVDAIVAIEGEAARDEISVR